MFTYFTLGNGLRLVMRHLPDTPAEMCGIAVNAGSRDEEPDEHGLAHFVEHTVFKGTLRRRAFHINNRMESVGANSMPTPPRRKHSSTPPFPPGSGFWTARPSSSPTW